MPLDFRFPDFCSYLRQIISPVSRVAIIITQMSQCSQMCQGCPASVTGRGQNYCSRFSVSFPLVILGTFVAGVPVCLLLTRLPTIWVMVKFCLENQLRLLVLIHLAGRCRRFGQKHLRTLSGSILVDFFNLPHYWPIIVHLTLILLAVSP